MLNKSDVNNVRPKPGMLLVQRDESPTTHSGLYIPSPSGFSKRSSLVTVIATSHGAEAEGLAPGDRLVLSSAGGQRIEFGDRDPIKLEAIYPDQIMLRFGSVIQSVEFDHPLKGFQPRDLVLDEQEILTRDEGEREGSF